MIGHLQGKLIQREDTSLVIDVGGVGYEVEVTSSTLDHLPLTNEFVSLYTHFVVREDIQALYGFAGRSERDLFRSLIRISGVGPKLAVTLLSGVETAEFARCIRDKDVSTLVKIPGIGRKTAERLLVELEDKIKQWLPEGSLTLMPVVNGSAQVIAEAEQALIALGYRPQEASHRIAQVYVADLTTEQVVKEVLKLMATSPT